ncbi:hypothetical protein AYL99_11838 [Fonsecaea erecta]|uniref:Uncharacterized protein n=1 Tax=Fonsecaea erecta TaxID=1367422 RepID=A0A178Z2C7_9EURO|nr:hypothetical protein AYL99_11838 [Fonsecaea erecta]OAP53958.1 hypothetical protein AYL99_11838 [Fonsecaea erecta]
MEKSDMEKRAINGATYERYCNPAPTPAPSPIPRLERKRASSNGSPCRIPPVLRLTIPEKEQQQKQEPQKQEPQKPDQQQQPPASELAAAVDMVRFKPEGGRRVFLSPSAQLLLNNYTDSFKNKKSPPS